MSADLELASRLWALTGSVEVANRHRVAGLIYALSPDVVPSEVRPPLRRALLDTTAQNLMFWAETVGVLGCLKDAGVRAMPLKGVLFGARYYPRLGARPQSDIDVLVCPEDLEKAHGILLRSGWEEAWPRAFYEGHYHWVYRRVCRVSATPQVSAGTGPLLELHWALKPRGTATPNLDRIWSGAREVELPGGWQMDPPGARSRQEAERPRRPGEVRWRPGAREVEPPGVREMEPPGVRYLEMGPEDTLAYLAVNKGMQHFPTLLDFVDLHRIVHVGDVSWPRLVEEAVADGTAGILWFGLSQSRELLGTRVPEPVLRDLLYRGTPQGTIWLKRILERWGGPLEVPSGFTEGPVGRVYEALLESRPRVVASLLLPLVLPSRARLEVLAGGSYRRYVSQNLKALGRQLLRARRA